MFTGLDLVNVANERGCNLIVVTGDITYVCKTLNDDSFSTIIHSHLFDIELNHYETGTVQ